MNKRLGLSVVLVSLGLILFAVVFAAGDGIPQSAVGLCSGIGGALIGLGGTELFHWLLMRALNSEERKEAARSERDERSIAIRTHAAQDSWYWTLYLLWIPFLAALVQGESFWMILCPAVIFLHCAFYLFHMYRWSKRM